MIPVEIIVFRALGCHFWIPVFDN